MNNASSILVYTYLYMSKSSVLGMYIYDHPVLAAFVFTVTVTMSASTSHQLLPVGMVHKHSTHNLDSLPHLPLFEAGNDLWFAAGHSDGNGTIRPRLQGPCL